MSSVSLSSLLASLWYLMSIFFASAKLELPTEMLVILEENLWLFLTTILTCFSP
jgi:hypothetical protein